MKKILSLVLALGMMLSVSIIPAQAAVSTDYPYIHYDFSSTDTMSRLNVGQVSGTRVDTEGIGGVPGALYVTQKSDATNLEIAVQDPSILQGKFKMSAWVKVDTTKTKLKNGEFGFVLWAPATDDEHGSYNGTAGKLHPDSWEMDWKVSLDLNKLNAGQWVYVEKVVENWDGIMRHGYYTPNVEGANVRFAPRLGMPSTGVLSHFLADDSPTKTSCWYLDDFIIEPILDPKSEPVSSTDGNVLIDVDFSKQLSEYSDVMTFQQDYSRLNYGYYTFNKSNITAYNEISINPLPIKYNKIYRISFRAKANDAATVGTQMKLIGMRMDTKRDENDTQNKYQFMNAMDPATGEVGTLTTVWKNYELYMTRQLIAAFHDKISFAFRWVNVDRHTSSGATDYGMEPVNFSLDDFKFEELPTVANGDFEWLKTDVVTSVEERNMNDNDSKKYGTFYGWRDTGATVAAVTDVPSESEGERSAKITVNTVGGSVEQGIYIPNNSQKVIKFWAKGEGDSVGKTIQVKLNRTVATKDSRDVYPVQDVELLGDGTLTADWKEYTIPYNIAIPKPAGASSYAEPRSPFLSFVVDGGTAGLTYYLDDVVVENPTFTYTRPYVTGMNVSGNVFANEKLTLSYLYNSDVNDPEGNTVIRVSKSFGSGYATIAQFVPETSGSAEYTIPESALGSKLKFEVLPITKADIDGVVTAGPIATYTTGAVKEPFVLTAALGEFNVTNSSVTGTLTLENNLPDPDDKPMKLMLAIVVYDEEGGIIRYDSKPISVVEGKKDTITLSVSTADVDGLDPVHHATAFVWGGTSIFDTDMVSYCEPITVAKPITVVE